MSACSSISATSANGSSASGSGSGSGTTSGLPPNPDNHLLYGDWCGCYTPGGSDFGGYLHNPYGYNYLSKPCKDAVDLAKMRYPKGNFPEIEQKIYDTLHHFFGDRSNNQRMGLTKQYGRLHFAVESQKTFYEHNHMEYTPELIGLILWGADGSRPEVWITKYTQPDGTIITLTVQSICYYYLKEFVKEENLDQLCEEGIIKEKKD